MKLSSNSYFLIFVLLLMLFVVGVSFRYGEISLKLLPILVGSVVFILAAVQLLKELVAPVKTRSGIQEVPPGEVRGEVRRFSSTMGWLIGFFLSIYLLGVLVAVPAFIISYSKFRGRGWFTAIALGVTMTVVVYVAFEFLLKTPLYRGLIFGG